MVLRHLSVSSFQRPRLFSLKRREAGEEKSLRKFHSVVTTCPERLGLVPKHYTQFRIRLTWSTPNKYTGV